MAKIICSLPNASEEINGVAFERHVSGGVISKEHLDADHLVAFTSIPGYAIDGETAGVVHDDAHPAAEPAAAGPAGDHGAAADHDAAGHGDAGVPAAAAADAHAAAVEPAAAPVAAKKAPTKKAAAAKK